MKTPRLKPKKGWAVEVQLGSSKPWLSCWQRGDVPVVCKHRAEAVVFCNYLMGEATTIHYKARVVRVLYAEPIRI